MITPRETVSPDRPITNDHAKLACTPSLPRNKTNFRAKENPNKDFSLTRVHTLSHPSPSAILGRRSSPLCGYVSLIVTSLLLAHCPSSVPRPVRSAARTCRLGCASGSAECGQINPVQCLHRTPRVRCVAQDQHHPIMSHRNLHTPRSTVDAVRHTRLG